MGWPVTPVAVKVTGWQTDGLDGDTVTPPTFGSGLSTTTALLAGKLSPVTLWEVSITVFVPAVENVTGTLAPKPLDGEPSGWNVQLQDVGCPEEASVKVTGVPG